MMRTFLVCILFISSGFSALAQQPKVVKVKPGFATVIVCPVQPELVSVGNPDKYSAQNAGRYILVKPLVNSGSTNMFIKAGNSNSTSSIALPGRCGEYTL